MNIRFIKLDPKAVSPSRANSTDAGADLSSTQNIIIAPFSRELIKTGICLEIPNGYYGRIAPRSGLAVKNGIDVLAGVVDSGYRGELCVALFNTDRLRAFEIKEGDRIAQIIFEQHYNFDFLEVKSLSDTDRSIKGFGSSGIN